MTWEVGDFDIVMSELRRLNIRSLNNGVTKFEIDE